MFDDIKYKELFKVGPIETEISKYATAPVHNDFSMGRVFLSQGDSSRFYTTMQCFDDAMDFIEGVVAHHQERRKSVKHWNLCHGILKYRDIEFSHGWVERDEEVYESRVYKGERVFAYSNLRVWRELWNPQHLIRYDVAQARQMLQTTTTAGPWDPLIREKATTEQEVKAKILEEGKDLAKQLGLEAQVIVL